MSGYCSKAEAVSLVKATIRMGSASTPDLSRDPADYFVSRVVEDVVFSRGRGYGWGISYDPEVFYASLRRHRRS